MGGLADFVGAELSFLYGFDCGNWMSEFGLVSEAAANACGGGFRFLDGGGFVGIGPFEAFFEGGEDFGVGFDLLGSCRWWGARQILMPLPGPMLGFAGILFKKGRRVIYEPR